MMRSLYSGVAGLKTHQIKMDVIGNNIANVNTTAYKSQSITFSELMYQTTQAASGPNETTGTAGVNAKQIGLGVTSGAISTAITTAGATQTTGNPFDIRITGDSFFIVNDGMNNYFTRDGSFYVDAAGNLAMTANGYNVMGWGVDPTTQTIKQDIVEPLRIMSADNLTYPPEATTKAYVSGILDKNDTNAASADGKVISVSIYDGLGYSYTAKFAIKNLEEEGQYTVELTDVLDGATNESLVDRYNLGSIKDLATFGQDTTLSETVLASMLDGVTYDATGDGTYYKTVGFSETFSDYDAQRVSGITYSVPTDPTDPNYIAEDTEFAPNAKVTLNGTGTISKDDLEEAFNLIYYVDAAKGKCYYYLNENGDPVTLNNDSSADEWAKALGKDGLEDFQATMDADGNVSFTFTQKFTVDGNTTYDGTNFVKEITIEEAYGVDTTKPNTTYEFMVAPDGQAQITSTTILSGNTLVYDTATGEFKSINGADTAVLDFAANTVDILGNPVDLTHFSDVTIDWTASSMFNNNKTSTIGMVSGDKQGLGSGRKLGELSGVSIQNNGMIYASYDNGQTRLLGQIAVASFSNASGLQKEGDNLYSATLNSGEFDGIGVDVTAGGGYMSTGVLEMSNVDLSAEFTEMITTQRGFQANSRIITVSDTLLEELVNLKR